MPLKKNVLQAAYIAVMRNTSNDIKNGFKHLLRLYREVDAVQEKTRILRKNQLHCPE